VHDFIQATLANMVAIFLVAIALVVVIWATYFARILAKHLPGSSRQVYFPYTLYSVFISAWILSNAYFQSDLLVYFGADTAIIMALLANIFSGLAFAYAFLFSCRLVSERTYFQLKTWQWILFSLTCIIILVTNCVPGLNVKSVDIEGIGSFVIHFGPTVGVFFGNLLLLLILTLGNFILSSRSQLKLKQIKANYMIFGMMAFIISTFFAHFLIPIFLNDFSKAWLPPALSIIEVIIVGYALLHHRFYSIRYIGLITLSFVINAVIYIIPIASVGFVGTQDSTLLLVIWTLITGICWYKSLAIIRRSVNRLLYKEKGDPVENICNLIGEFSYSTDQAIIKLNQVLNAKSGRIQKVSGNTENNIFVSYFHGNRSVLIKEEIEYQLKHEKLESTKELSNVTREMVNMGVSLVLPITNEKNEVTQLYMVSKEKENVLFSSEEIMGLQLLFDKANCFIVTEDKIRKSQVLVGTIAHEIRNPLTKIKYHFERIDADMFGIENTSLSPFASKEMKKIYQELSEGQKAVQLGSRFIDAILDELRGESIGTTLFDNYSVARLTHQALNDFCFNSEEHKLRINVDTQSDFFFHGSDTLYSFVLFNLIKNAVYYFDTYPNSQIRIYFQKERNYNKVHVVDTGPGISPDHQKHILEEFYTNGKVQGNGLGLSYCKRVIESFGGTITCQSELGEYTEFILSFPSIDEKIHSEMSKEKIKSYLTGMSGLVLGSVEAGNWLSSEFKSLGVELCTAPDVETGLHHLSQQTVDFIIMDHMLLNREMGSIKMLRAGTHGHQAQTTPMFLYGYTENSEHSNSIELSPFFQGQIDGIYDHQAFQHSLESLIDNDLFAKLGSLIGKTVLVVDDMQVNRMLVQAYLASEGITVVQASSGDEAIEKVKKEPFNLVLMDIQMPGMSGIEATHQIRHLFDAIPIVALSGEYNEEITHAISETMNDHLVKPINKQQLLQTLTKWMT
jgi:two-component system, autoinducer 1 sensor kinase/phosphatase LuxN